MAAEDLLNDDERRALNAGKLAHRRAEALLSTAQLGGVLDLSPDAMTELVDSVRSRLSDVDGKVPKQLLKALANLIGVLVEADEHRIPPQLAIEAPVSAEVLQSELIEKPITVQDSPQPTLDIPEAIILEVRTQPQAQSPDLAQPELDIPDAIHSTSVDKNEVEIDPMAEGRTFLKAITPGEYEGLTSEHADSIAELFVKIAGFRPRSDSTDHKMLIRELFSGLTRREIADKYQMMYHSVTQNLSRILTKVKLSPYRSEIESLVTRLIEGESVEDILKSLNIELDTKEELTAEPEIVEAPKPEVINKPEAKPITISRFSPVPKPIPVPKSPTPTRPVPSAPPTPLPPFLPSESALERERHNIVTAARVRDIRLATENSRYKTEQEWRELARFTLTDLTQRVGFSSEESDALWAKLHFDDKGIFRAEPDDVTLQAANKLRSIFNKQKNRALAGRRFEGTGLATLLSSSHDTLRSLDEAYNAIHKLHPKVSPQEVERFVISGAVEVLYTQADRPGSR